MDSVRGIVFWLAGCSAGLLVAGRYSSGLSPTYGLAALAVSLLLLIPLALAWKNKRVRYASFLLILAWAGCARALLVHPPESPASLAYYKSAGAAAKVTVTGTVRDEPVRAD